MSAALYGYDGRCYSVGDRVELHPGLDWWMRGAKFATVVGSRLTPQDRVIVVLDCAGSRKFSAPADRFRVVL